VSYSRVVEIVTQLNSVKIIRAVKSNTQTIMSLREQSRQALGSLASLGGEKTVTSYTGIIRAGDSHSVPVPSEERNQSLGYVVGNQSLFCLLEKRSVSPSSVSSG
jgi:hypothetical protein